MTSSNLKNVKKIYRNGVIAIASRPTTFTTIASVVYADGKIDMEKSEIFSDYSDAVKASTGKSTEELTKEKFENYYDWAIENIETVNTNYKVPTFNEIWDKWFSANPESFKQDQRYIDDYGEHWKPAYRVAIRWAIEYPDEFEEGGEWTLN